MTVINFLKVFHTDGDFLYKFGNEGDESREFDHPRCLSVDKAGHLMVCDSGNDTVQILELNGKSIANFELMSNGIEECFWPVSTAVLSDGRIVVSNFCNDCIQLIE